MLSARPQMALTVLETDITDKIAVIRKQQVIADADVAELYGVETRRVNVAMKNNVDRFPSDYMFDLTKSGLRDLRSKISTTNFAARSVNELMGIVAGDRLYPIGDTVSLSAIANCNYRFVYRQDSITDNPRLVVAEKRHFVFGIL